jgi:quinol monooxygenase YgiN
MIHVIATIELVEGSREEFLPIFCSNIPRVKAEKGCMSYTPTIDVDSSIPIQDPLRDIAVTIIETWESLESRHAHLKAPHMA